MPMFTAVPHVSTKSQPSPNGRPAPAPKHVSYTRLNRFVRAYTAAATLALLLPCGWAMAAGQVADSVAPETGQAASASANAKQGVVAQRFMVSTANPVASEAGYQVLKAGGSAADAYVAIQTVLGLVEPQSSGLGGGAFAVYYDANASKLTTFDGRETAPLAARPELFQDAQGKPLKFFDAVIGGRSVGTPGTVALMDTLHQRYGQQAWDALLQPAIRLATDGFEVSPRMAESIARAQSSLQRYPDTAGYFLDADGQGWPAGTQLTNPAYAQTLALLAKSGAEAFYRGELAAQIAEKVQSVSDNPGLLAVEDFLTYKVKERPASCLEYTPKTTDLVSPQYSVCGMGPPSSGALTVGQILGISRHFDLAALGADSATAWQIIGDASRLAFADRGRYMADSDFVPMPAGLLDPDYLAQRAALIEPGRALTQVAAGEPRWNPADGTPVAQADDQSIEFPSTTHIAIVDAQGNALSITSTIENGFGSRLMSHGFLLNNELTDFSFASHKNGYPIANRLEPGKRPRSSMSPTIVLRDGKPYLLIGSPGGSRIIGYVSKTLIAHLVWGMEIQQAINLPNLVNRFGTYDIEQDSAAEPLAAELEALGYKVAIKPLNSGLQGIVIDQGRLLGGADPRREGLVLGD